MPFGHRRSSLFLLFHRMKVAEQMSRYKAPQGAQPHGLSCDQQGLGGGFHQQAKRVWGPTDIACQ